MQTKLFSKTKPGKVNTNLLTKEAIRYLLLKGFHVWRNNNVGVWDEAKGVYRKNPYTLLGVADIIGFRKSDALFIAVEIKTGSDKLSIHQQAFLNQVNKSGGIGLEVRSIEQLINHIK